MCERHESPYLVPRTGGKIHRNNGEGRAVCNRRIWGYWFYDDVGPHSPCPRCAKKTDDALMEWAIEKRAIDNAVSTFPKEFTMPGYTDKKCRVREQGCFMGSNGIVQIVVECYFEEDNRGMGSGWFDLVRDDVDAIHRNVRI